MYWGATALCLMNEQDRFDRQDIIKNVMECYHPNVGGFGGHLHHDPHLLNTLSAIQILATYDALEQVDRNAVLACNSLLTGDLKGLQNSDGSFKGDEYGEVDTRFSYCAVSCASLLNGLDHLDTKKAIEFIIKCQNFDGGFGSVPEAESHSGQSRLNLIQFFVVLEHSQF
jgi:geranylgeranyl transferase type-2 subunit beta